MERSLNMYRIRRRGALLLILSSFAMFLPNSGDRPMQALADDDGGSEHDGDSGGGGSDSDSGGSDDGGDDGDDGGGDGGDDGSDGGGPGNGGNGGNGGGRSASSGRDGRGGNSQNWQASDGALAKRLKNRIAPISEIQALASRAKPGEILDIKLYRDRRSFVYRVKILQRNGSIYDVKIDAVTRKLLSARQR